MIWNATSWIDEDAAHIAPAWMAPVIDALRGVSVHELTTFIPEPGVGRHSAVLMLFGETDGEPDILIIRRADTMRSHAGQPAFPGGGVDAHDASPIAAALRETHEEAGVLPGSVQIVGYLPDLWVNVSNYVVTPVVGWWREPHPIAPGDDQEVRSVHRIKVRDLVNPENRVRVQHPSGYIGAGFTIDDLLIWGFTAGVLSTLFDRVGWSRPWDPTRVVEIA
jgi:8-oxo-dGTP pyrophosphatase MutT (NUDIX family)